jgi:hypothetical protein
MVFRQRTWALLLSYNLNWGHHVCTNCRKVYGAFAGFRRLADVALYSYSLRELTVAFNACVRYVYCKRLFDHISDVSNSILSCFLLTYMEFWLACLMFSLVTGGRPHYLYDSLVFSRSERTIKNTLA